ncbi:MAG: hypothetical protein H7326_07580, partial [Bdellovibrionaceae bacterium]|nr:hypothetical protein [Pseudobdellovibrionaceae bacterium]
MKHIVELNQLWKPGFGIVLVGFGLLLSFQNCSKVNFTEGSVTPIQVAGATVDVVCDPFNVSGTCDPTSTKGLIGNVYHLPGEYDSVDRYISSGQKLDIYVQMSNLNIPTRSWSSGFPTSAGSTLKDAKGEALIEFFALDLKGAFVLTSNQTEGAYDFGVAADDGLILDIDGKTIVNNDGSH